MVIEFKWFINILKIIYNTRLMTEELTPRLLDKSFNYMINKIKIIYLIFKKSFGFRILKLNFKYIKRRFYILCRPKI